MFVESQTIIQLLPEIILVALATWMFVGGTFAGGRTFWSTFSLLGYLVAAFALYRHGWSMWEVFKEGDAFAPRGPITVDLLGYVLRWVALLVGIISTLAVSHSLRRNVGCELLGLIMLAVAGAMIASQATELVLLFLGLELVSIPTYILLFIGRPGRASAEATAKYFYLSILSSAMLLYGFSFLYGMSGTTALFGNGAVPGIRGQLAQLVADNSPLVVLAPLSLVLIFAGLGFKMAAVPFHFYAPDVYQGTTNVNAGILSVLPKVVGAVALMRFGVVMLPTDFASYAWQFALVIAVLTMTVGNICALWQTNVRRMMGYSSIAHAGYMLIGLAVALVARSQEGTEPQIGYGGMAAMLFYLIVYAVSSLGTFAVLAHLSNEGREVSTLEELGGLNQTKPIAAGLLALFMFSLAGIPPLAGFWGKLTLFTSAVSLAGNVESTQTSTWLYALAVAGSLNAAIAGAYYLRIVGAMYFRPSAVAYNEPGGAGGLSGAVICGVLVMLVGLSPGTILSSAKNAEKSAFRVPQSTLHADAQRPAAEPIARAE